MQVGFIQSVEGLKNKNSGSLKKMEFSRPQHRHLAWASRPFALLPRLHNLLPEFHMICPTDSRSATSQPPKLHEPIT